MSCLSIIRGRLPAVIVANPIFPISTFDEARKNKRLVFEVLKSDAGGLRSHVGTAVYYALDSTPFWGRLETLDSCESTHAGLGHLGHKPTLRGTIAIFDEPPSVQ